MEVIGPAVRLPTGKLPAALLARFLSSLPPPGDAVIVGPRPGEDAAVIDPGGPELLVAAADPITLASAGAAQALIAVNSNDIAVMGGEPRWLLTTLLLPEGVEQDRALDLLEELAEACRRASISLIGGHTEITAGLDRPLLCATLLGTVPRDGLKLSRDLRPGDAVLQVRPVALEGGAVLAREHAPRLLAAGVPPEVIRAAARWLDSPGISVLSPARAIRAIPGVRAMHDPTEGGIATALREFAEAGGVDFRIDPAAIRVLPECRTMCEALGLDPLGLLASGSLLVGVAPDAAKAVEEALEGAGSPAWVIGEVVERGAGNLDALPAFEADEITRVL